MKSLLRSLGFLLLLCVSFGCKSSDTNPNRTAYCGLWDPEKGSLLMPETAASKRSLEAWVSAHASKLSFPKTGERPRFVLLSISSDLRILDRVPLHIQRGGFSKADSDSLRACFRGGKPVAVNLAAGTVRPL